MLDLNYEDITDMQDTIEAQQERIVELEEYNQQAQSLNGLLEIRVEQLEAQLASLRENVNEYTSQIPLHTEDKHVLHYVEQIQAWCRAQEVNSKDYVRDE